MKPIPLTDRPQHLESFRGYLTRLAELNGYTDLRWIGDLLGEPPWALFNLDVAGFSLQRIAELLHQPLSAIKQIALHPIQGTDLHNFYGLRVRVKDIYGMSYRLSKICPACLSEFGYAFGYWDLKHTLECPIHRIPLRSTCSECGAKIRHNRPNLLQCTQCQVSLAKDATSEAPDTAGPHSNRDLISEWMDPRITTPLEILQAKFAGMTLGDLLFFQSVRWMREDWDFDFARRTSSKHRLLNGREVAALLKAAAINTRYPSRNVVIVLLAFDAGLGSLEIARLKRSSVALNNPLPTLSPEGRSPVPMTERLQAALQILLEKTPPQVNAPLICSERGKTEASFGANSISYVLFQLYRHIGISGANSSSVAATFRARINNMDSPRRTAELRLLTQQMRGFWGL